VAKPVQVMVMALLSAAAKHHQARAFGVSLLLQLSCVSKAIRLLSPTVEKFLVGKGPHCGANSFAV